MARILVVVAEKGFRDEEFDVPYRAFKAAGHEVTVASTGPGVAEGKLGMRVKPDTTVDAVDPSKFDAVVIAGGPGSPTYLWPNRKLHEILRDVAGRGGVVAAICLAPVTLAKAGLLSGKKCTVYRTPESVKEIEAVGGRLQKDHVVVDGKVVTGDGPDAARAFADAVLKLL
ncbi:MAG: DJ-1/PfpI family protein [Candidatus Verstraetearchaeota archaeon]|nr:DJ-1/PfpI family protein [Candidatus Verstraetearchaeota archaeon]